MTLPSSDCTTACVSKSHDANRCGDRLHSGASVGLPSALMLGCLALIGVTSVRDVKSGTAAGYPPATATQFESPATATEKDSAGKSSAKVTASQTDTDSGDDSEANADAGNAAREAELITRTRQITFEGRRAGEGYFSGDAKRMVFQSERDPSNPFYQIYLMEMETGDVRRISTGVGKTTCAWIHPGGDRVMFASTHADAASEKLQAAELEARATGKQRRYSWDYDPQYELYAKNLDDGKLQQLTDAKGYDAEGCYSPDGSKIVFASNRQAFERELTPRERQLFETDPASMMEIYVMDADGGNVTRLTDVIGYDGGPFFSPDGERICWRRFAENGATAEVYTMRTDGTDVKRLTEIDAMSWAPFYHPSGDYLVFTTNKLGFSNFELYLVRADGSGDAVRATYTDGFDGLPVFLPGGRQISWTSNRTESGRSQIFMAEWNDFAARAKLGLGPADRDDDDGGGGADDERAGTLAASETKPEFSVADLGRHVDYLTRPELGGRLTGTAGERRATAYVAAYLQSLGYQPAGEDGTFFQAFEFPAGSELTDENAMEFVTPGGNAEKITLNRQWQPLTFSRVGETPQSEIVCAGYGLVVPESDADGEGYDSYVHLDVTDKWVMVFRDMPQDITAEQRQQMARYSSPRRKATAARDRGAAGIIFVAGPTSKVRRQLIRFDAAASQASISIAAISVTNDVAAAWMAAAGKDLREVQKSYDHGEMAMGFSVRPQAANPDSGGSESAGSESAGSESADSESAGDNAGRTAANGSGSPASVAITVGGTIGIKRRSGTGRNVLARLPASVPSATSRQAVIVGAHIDHLGVGGAGNSLATEDEVGQIHVGADDNASGVAAMLEIAHYIANQHASGALQTRRDLIVGAWSGEELGLFGSQAYVAAYHDLYRKADSAEPVAVDEPTGREPGNDSAARRVAHAHGVDTTARPLTDSIAVYLNLDMVGRLRENLVVQGIGSSPNFRTLVQRRNVPVQLPLKLDQTATRLPTDASAFVGREVPILSAFTGAHADYHTPRDTPEKLNYAGAAKISRLFALLTRGFLVDEVAPEFALDEGEKKETPRVNLRAYLGTIPDYATGDIKGVQLSDVTAGAPAAVAGVRGGDVIVELAGRKIEDIYDYTYAIEALKIGETVKIVVERDGQPWTFDLTPQSRD